jgi:Family of unknown function (DUF6412)
VVILRLLAIASAEIATTWHVAAHALLAAQTVLTAQALISSSGLMAAAAVTLAAAIIALFAHRAWLGELAAGSLPGRAVALRRKSWAAAFQRQLNPDAAGHARPRAPAAA